MSKRFLKGPESPYDPALHNPLVHGLAKAGYTQAEIGREFGITVTSLQRWFNTYPEFRLQWEAGRTECMAHVENELWKMCSTHKTKTVIRDGQGNVKEIIEKDLPPSIQAMSLYLRAKDKKYCTQVTELNASANLTVQGKDWVPPVDEQDKQV